MVNVHGKCYEKERERRKVEETSVMYVGIRNGLTRPRWKHVRKSFRGITQPFSAFYLRIDRIFGLPGSDSDESNFETWAYRLTATRDASNMPRFFVSVHGRYEERILISNHYQFATHFIRLRFRINERMHCWRIAIVGVTLIISEYLLYIRRAKTLQRSVAA